ncbi:MAG: ATP-binding protein [Chlamydiae bacterium]|nr:ATP-binding protein [Chlamydiota bacterium]MBI3266055.1 ATP-binding protein [Chlamydiota bacterium]
MFQRRILKYLDQWKTRSDRKPLILRGARQVGKTVSVRLFGQHSFKNFIEINLENPEHALLFKTPLSVDDFEKVIQVKMRKTLKDGETLLFMDEIQNSPVLIQLLRFFHEERPGLHVIAAGSLLDVKLQKEGLAFPVGRVEYAYLYPLDFFEFLHAKGELELLKYLEELKRGDVILPAMSIMAEKLFSEYMMVGGMPEAVNHFVKQNDFIGLDRIDHSLMVSYHEDILKYASLAKAKYLEHVLEKGPLFAGQRVTYEHFGGSNFKSREMSEAFDLLEKAMLFHRVTGTPSTALPLVSKKKKPPKILFLDVGLIHYKLGIRDRLIDFARLDETFRGRIAEQVVGQHLVITQQGMPETVHYWYRESPGSTAEVDYVLFEKGELTPIEVKSGKSGRLRSLKEFVTATGQKKAMRVYQGPFVLETIQIEDTHFELLSLPFFLLPRIRDFLGSSFRP